MTRRGTIKIKHYLLKIKGSIELHLMELRQMLRVCVSNVLVFRYVSVTILRITARKPAFKTRKSVFVKDGSLQAETNL